MPNGCFWCSPTGRPRVQSWRRSDRACSVAAPPFSDARGVAVEDPARSVSKTHALVEAARDGISITDLHSTNGVRIRTDDVEPHELAPGIPAVVLPGSSLLLGDLELRVERLHTDTV